MGRPTTGERQYQFHTYIVYGLMCGYAGYTRNTYNRMRAHKHNGKDVEGWFILAVCKSKREALDKEREFHDNGHYGKVLGHKTYTEEERIAARKETFKKSRIKNADKIKKYKEDNKESHKEYQKEYRLRNKEYFKEYRDNIDKDKVREYNKAYREKNKEKNKEDREKNKEYQKEYQKKYRSMRKLNKE